MKSSPTKLILASQSPRRRDLLTEAGIAFDVVPADVDEVVDPSASPEENAIALARIKARHVAKLRPQTWVLGADTIVVLDGQLLGKPNDKDDAQRMLSMLSGNTHEVITGMTIIAPGGESYEDAATSTITMHTLTKATISEYIATGEPMDKAGAYAIQGKGGALVASHSGSYSNIVGLPIEQAIELLKRSGFRPEAKGRCS